MRFHAEILAQNEDGVLERILRVCRNRGFISQSLRAFSDEENKLMHIHIEGSSDRSLAQLSLQVKKLLDVIEVVVRILPSDVRRLEVETQSVTINIPMRRPVYVSSSRG